MQTLNPQSFSLENSGNEVRPTEGPRFVHVPFSIDAIPGPSFVNGIYETVEIDLSYLTQGLPSKHMSMIQGLIVSNPRGQTTNGATISPFVTDAFQLRVKFNNGFMVPIPDLLNEPGIGTAGSYSGAYCGVPILATPPSVVKVELWNFNMVVDFPTRWDLDFWFTNFPVRPFTLPSTRMFGA